MEATEGLSPQSTESFQDGYISVIDRSPENPKTETPVFISPGWSENDEVLKDVVKELLNSGRRVITLSYSGVRDSDKKTDHPSVEVGKAEAILEVIRLKGLKNADVVGHSEGAIGAIIAASLEPDKIRNLILVGPAGLIGKDTFPKLLGRFSMKVMKDHYRLLKDGESRKPMARFLQQGAKFAIRHPVQGIREAIAISQVQLEDVLRDIHSQGVGTGIVSGVDDPVFKMSRLQQVVKADMVDAFVSVKGGHDEFHLQPRYARATEQLLTSLENRNR